MKEKIKGVIRAIFKSIVFVYFKIVYRIEIKGKENIPKEGALIFCGNHRNYLDPPLIIVTAGRHLHFIAKDSLQKVPTFKTLGKLFGIIFIKRDSKDIGALKESLKCLKKGECIGLFPEGTRNGLEKGNQMKNGVSYFVLNSDAKVIPVGIIGGLKPFQKATIVYGKPMDFEKEKQNKKDKDVMEKVTNDIMKEVIKLTNI